jgi:hypothetical protein
MMKKNPSQAASEAQSLRPQPSTTRGMPSSFILHTSYFKLLPFAFCVLIFAFAFCLLPTVLNAQGCAMCYNSASAAKAGAKEALANGVLILLVPPMVFFALITVVVYRYRNKFRELSVVRGPWSVARKSNDRESWRSDEPSAEAADIDFWSPDHSVIQSPNPLPRATDDGQRASKLQGQGN